MWGGDSNLIWMFRDIKVAQWKKKKLASFCVRQWKFKFHLLRHQSGASRSPVIFIFFSKSTGSFFHVCSAQPVLLLNTFQALYATRLVYALSNYWRQVAVSCRLFVTLIYETTKKKKEEMTVLQWLTLMARRMSAICNIMGQHFNSVMETNWIRRRENMFR